MTATRRCFALTMLMSECWQEVAAVNVVAVSLLGHLTDFDTASVDGADGFAAADDVDDGSFESDDVAIAKA